MLENPGDELFFGEVYRTVLQEAWLPEGSVHWQRTGISRRGRRPTQQGLYPHSPTPKQAIIRQCFSKCVSAWNSLPWDNPNDAPCDARWGKEYWKKEKDDRGVPCSYYDLFMRYCLKHCINTTCVMPSAYALDCGPDLTDVVCFAEYSIPFSGACGPISLTSGVGSFSPPDIWTAPLCGDQGILAFKDKNGAQGCLRYSFNPSHHCNGFSWADTNPVEITPGTQESISVEGGAGPFTWQILGVDFSLSEPGEAGASNTLIAGPDACGAALIFVTDFCKQKICGTVRSTDGQWVFKSPTCELSGTGIEVGAGGPPPWHDYELITGKQKQTQRTVFVGTGNYDGPCPSWCVDACGDGCDECVGDGKHPVPCEAEPTPLLPDRIICWKIGDLKYYEWEC